MKLYFAGTHHGDPYCIEKLHKFLYSIRHNNLLEPVFIAVEYGRRIFESKVLTYRREFLEFIKEDDILKNLSSPTIDLLTKLIGYEADTHQYFFPNTKTLWLNECRIIETPSNLARNAFGRIKNIADSLSKPISDFELLEKLHEDCKWYWEKPIQGNHDFSRDEKWSNLIRKTVEKYGLKDYAIIIVGAVHTQSRDRFLVNLLKERSFYCDVKIMK